MLRQDKTRNAHTHTQKKENKAKNNTILRTLRKKKPKHRARKNRALDPADGNTSQARTLLSTKQEKKTTRPVPPTPTPCQNGKVTKLTAVPARQRVEDFAHHRKGGAEKSERHPDPDGRGMPRIIGRGPGRRLKSVLERRSAASCQNSRA